MRVALDTNAYVALHRGDTSIHEVLRLSDFVGVPAVVLGELCSGFRQGTRGPENKAQLARFLAKPSVQVLPITAETALRYAEIDFYLRTRGRPIPRNDVWIGASAIEHGLHLLTLDHHFLDIPLLLVQPER
ncbi:MAG: type II toxin-antitoxin system VapC family toxin [Bryobacteraceae bacterium]